MEQREDGSRPRGRRSGLRLGRLFGFPLYLSPSWLVLAALITAVYGHQVSLLRPALPAVVGYGFGAAFVLCLLGSVLLHELGHALASLRFGTGVRGITLELLGGYTEMEREAPRPRVEALVSLAGPAVSMLLALMAGVATVALPAGGLPAEFVGRLAVSNAIIAVFNVLPGLPLDGGRALQAAVWAASGDRHRARLVGGWAGRAIALACVFVGIALYLTGVLSLVGVVFGLMVAASIWFGASTAVRLGRAGMRLRLLAVDELARPVFRVPSGTPLGEARRRAAAAGRPDAALGVVDGADRVHAVVHDAAAAAVPPGRRDWIPVDEVARQVHPHRVLPAGLRGGEVLRAVESDPVGDYLVTAGEDVVGILRVADLARALERRRSNR